MPRLSRAQKNARRAKQEDLKASPNSNDNNDTITSQATVSQQDSALHGNACSSTSHVIRAGGHMAQRGKQEALKASHNSNDNNNTIDSQATVSEKDSALHRNACGSTSHVIPAGGHMAPHPVAENNAVEVKPAEIAGMGSAENAKDGTDGAKRGSLRKSGEEEFVILQPSRLELSQKQRGAGWSSAGNKGFSEGGNMGLNCGNYGQFQGYKGEGSRRGGRQQGRYQNDGRGRGRSYDYGSQGGGDNSDRIDALGRALSSVLRHKAVGLGLKVRSDGYVEVKDLLSLSTKTWVGLPFHSHSVDDLKEVVKRDNKQRFGLHEENGQLLIRANQGHSIKTICSMDLLNPIVSYEEVPVCIHGTYLKYLKSIQKEGLKRMKRNHVHFTTGLCKEDGIISGMRSNCEVLIYLNVQKALKDGMKLYRSENGVILTEGFDGVVPCEYFAKIEGWGKKGTQIFE